MMRRRGVLHCNRGKERDDGFDASWCSLYQARYSQLSQFVFNDIFLDSFSVTWSKWKNKKVTVKA